MAQQLIKVVLRTGKVVFFRPMVISDTEKAAQRAASSAGGDQNVLQILMQKEIIKLLLVRMAAKEGDKPEPITGEQRANFDSLFTVAEYTSLLKVVGKISGDEEAGKDLPLEMVSLEG